MVNQLLGVSSELEINEMAQLFSDFADGCLSVPINFPGFAYYTAMKVPLCVTFASINSFTILLDMPRTLFITSHIFLRLVSRLKFKLSKMENLFYQFGYIYVYGHTRAGHIFHGNS